MIHARITPRLFSSVHHVARCQRLIAPVVALANSTLDFRDRAVVELVRSLDDLPAAIPGLWAGWRLRFHARDLRAHAPRRIDNLCRYSPVFRAQPWRRIRIKDTTRGPLAWEVKTARVHLVVPTPRGQPPRPSERRYWLILARAPATQELKYFISNAAENVALPELLKVAFARWHVEKWFERAKQEVGLGAFEVRTYTSLIRHWLCAQIAMYFLAAQTQRLRGEKSAGHVRTSGRGDQRPVRQDLQPLLAFMD